MIIKGGSRAAPAQLARHLQRRDTNENVHILELQSLVPDLGEAFRDWQTLVEGTRGYKGLYHANIDPAKDYTMTREQWRRAVEVLEKELGLEGQPRAVVLHEKHGREHIHVVWARTDIDEMILRSDSQNYQAHERASQRLEQEFGHEQVPGKHAKRDREKQPEFPRAEANHAEWQQGERTGIAPAARKEQVTALKQSSDSAQAFKAALEEQGYVLAKGDRRDFVIVDQTGAIHSLGRQIHGVKAAELREFMKSIDREVLPTTAAAKEIQHRRSQETERPEKQSEADSKPPAPVPDAIKVQTEALRKAFAEREAAERQRLVGTQAVEMKQLHNVIDADTRKKLERFDATHRVQTEARRQRRAQEQAPAGIAGLISSIQDLISPDRVAEREAGRQRKEEQVAERQKQERDDYVGVLRQTNTLEIENVTERHAQQLRDHATRAGEDLDRYMREQEAARKLQAEVEERERQREQERARDGHEWPPPRAR